MMFEGKNSIKIESEFYSLLRTTKRRVVRAWFKSRISIGMEAGFIWLIRLAVVYVILSFIFLATHHSLPQNGYLYGLMAVLTLFLSVSISIFTGLRDKPTFLDVAERLDLNAQDHNRIATAIYLLKEGRRDDFSEAAIAGGLEAIKKIKDMEPYRPGFAIRYRETGYRLLISIVIFSFLFWLGSSGQKASAKADVSDKPLASIYKKEPTQYEKPVRKDISVSPTNQQPVLKSESGEGGRSVLETKKNADFSPDQTLGDSSNGKSNGNESLFNQATGSKSESPESPSNSAQQMKRNMSKKADSKQKYKTAKIDEKNDRKNESSFIGSGSGGSGQMSTVENSWSTREQSTNTAVEEENEDQNIDEQKESSSQRGGIQPMLKDRHAAPSRELGKDEGEGEPGTGRGGPSPMKKSRGTASLVLGVPLPDFIKGQIGPGVTKMTQERVSPITSPGKEAKAEPIHSVSHTEEVQMQFDIPYQYTELVRNYLLRLHSVDQHYSDRKE